MYCKLDRDLAEMFMLDNFGTSAPPHHRLYLPEFRYHTIVTERCKLQRCKAYTLYVTSDCEATVSMLAEGRGGRALYPCPAVVHASNSCGHELLLKASTC